MRKCTHCHQGAIHVLTRCHYTSSDALPKTIHANMAAAVHIRLATLHLTPSHGAVPAPRETPAFASELNYLVHASDSVPSGPRCSICPALITFDRRLMIDLIWSAITA